MSVHDILPYGCIPQQPLNLHDFALVVLPFCHSWSVCSDTGGFCDLERDCSCVHLSLYSFFMYVMN